MLQKTISSELFCFHCGLPVAGGEQFCAEFNGVQNHFCCPACRAIAMTIVDSGLSSFYQFQTQSKRAAKQNVVDDTFSLFDETEFQERFVSREAEGSAYASCDLLIEGMHCTACVWLLEKYVNDLPGIDRVNVNFTEQKASIKWQPEKLTLSAVVAAISRLGYAAEPFSADVLLDSRIRENHLALRRLGVAGIVMMQVGMFAIALHAGALQGIETEYRDFIRWISLLVTLPVVLYSAQPFFIGAWRGVVLKKPGMDLPVAIAIALAFSASCRATISGHGDVYFDSVTMFTFLLLAGRYLELRARHYSGRMSSNLNSLLPSTAIRLTPECDDSGTQERVKQQIIPLYKIKIGDRLLVKSGQVIPADGIIISGESSINEAQLTGEFMPKYRVAGDSVIAGTVNGDGSLTINVSATGTNLKIESVNRLISDSHSRKPRIAQIADQFAGFFITAVLALSLMTYFYWTFIDSGEHASRAFWIMLSVLVVSCPCALSLATPAALTAAGNRLRTNGVLVTEPQVWEKMKTITDVVFDKTGTLTRGELSLLTIKPIGQVTADRCIEIASALESFSNHPIASVFPSPNGVTTDVHDVKISTGEGLEGRVNGHLYRIGSVDYATGLSGGVATSVAAPGQGQWILMTDKGGPFCWFQIQDSLRDGAQELVSILQSRNYKTHLVSGDSSGEAQLLSGGLGMDNCIAGASPQDKLEYCRALRSEGANVMILGDGINDIPVLAEADISIAMSNASCLAKTHADCILLSGNLTTVAVLIDLAENTRKVIKQNIAWAFGYNLIVIPLAVMGLIPPYVAAVGMSLSSLVVILNSLRLQGFKKYEQVQTETPLVVQGEML
ncbi:MAG: Cu2+-exporting ATPase [Oceanicoccus sp.]|jgi:Cu2+-exporting ATPase